jgi:putative chitinase
MASTFSNNPKQPTPDDVLDSLSKVTTLAEDRVGGIFSSPSKKDDTDEDGVLSFFGGMFRSAAERAADVKQEVQAIMEEEARRSAESAALYRMERNITQSPVQGVEEETTDAETTDTSAAIDAAVTKALEESTPTTVETETVAPTGGLMSPPVDVNALEGPEAMASASIQSLSNQTDTVSRGAKGTQVLNAQLRLAELGYDIGRGGKKGLSKNALGQWVSLDNSQMRGVDSDFGPSTERAVKAFQEDAGLPVTGIIDPETAKALADKPAVEFTVPQDFLDNLSDKQKVIFDSAKNAATEAGLKGAELASFMAQVAHESDNFNSVIEYASGNAYEGRSDLGNTQPGDGARYKGRGHIQLTGRANYKKAGDALGLDLVGNPELVEDPKVAADVSIWFWKNKVRPQVPDFLDTERVTKVVNGGFRGLDHRKSSLKTFTKKWNED